MFNKKQELNSAKGRLPSNIWSLLSNSGSLVCSSSGRSGIMCACLYLLPSVCKTYLFFSCHYLEGNSIPADLCLSHQLIYRSWLKNLVLFIYLWPFGSNLDPEKICARHSPAAPDARFLLNVWPQTHSGTELRTNAVLFYLFNFRRVT